MSFSVILHSDLWWPPVGGLSPGFGQPRPPLAGTPVGTPSPLSPSTPHGVSPRSPSLPQSLFCPQPRSRDKCALCSAVPGVLGSGFPTSEPLRAAPSAPSPAAPRPSQDPLPAPPARWQGTGRAPGDAHPRWRWKWGRPSVLVLNKPMSDVAHPCARFQLPSVCCWVIWAGFS